VSSFPKIGKIHGRAEPDSAESQGRCGLSVIIDFAVFPTDKGESVSAHVARAIRVIRDSGLDHRVHAMGTTIEGEWDEVLGVVDRCFKEMRKGSRRVYLTLKADYREGSGFRIDKKVASLEEKL
jgi:uncharacterized protein (TIGR00106 family)